MMEVKYLTDGIGTIDNFLPAAACEALIFRSEEIGYEGATVTTDNGPEVIASLRNNDRVLLDDDRLAVELWSSLHSHIPSHFGTTRRAVGLNERFRFYRYKPRQRFGWHLDGHFARTSGERSFFTFMIYLNDGYLGGETIFSDRPERDHPRYIIEPKVGTALIFRHLINHTGAAVKHGTKYVLRSDVMYSPA